MNQWQPMIDRCEALSSKVDMILQVRSFNSDADADLTLRTIDDLETVLYALRYAVNSLGAMKMGASQQSTCAPVLSKHNEFNPQTELHVNYSTEADCVESDGIKENPADWSNEK